MHGRPVHQNLGYSSPSHPDRWRVLGILVLALLVTSIDHTIINVALPGMVRDLGASAAQLQWVFAAYTVVFAGLLLTAGSAGDRLGRRHALAGGLAVFLAGSVLSATAGSVALLIAGRGVMGVGGALIMPSTLSIIVNTFGDPRERAKAIAIWTAAAGAGIAVGPIVGGALMRSFSWSSVFWINVPLLAVALLGTLHVVPESRDPQATRLDPVGALTSIVAIGTAVYAIIDAPTRGWTSGPTLTTGALSLTAIVGFIRWELRRDEPMLDMRLFANRSFSAGSVTLSLLFFAMAGTVFLQAQYLQFVLGYSPLVAGAALVPAALGMLVGTGAGAHLAGHAGPRIAVVAGTALASMGIAAQAAFVDGTGYLPTGIGLLLFGVGAGVAMPPATDLIMATLPPARAGVGSAVNDTVREIGGALGVAVVGSIAASGYATSMDRSLARIPDVTASTRLLLTDNVGSALQASTHLGDRGQEIASLARSAFVDSMSVSLWVGVALAATSTLVALRFLPRARATDHFPAPTEATGHLGHVEAIARPVAHAPRATIATVSATGERRPRAGAHRS